MFSLFGLSSLEIECDLKVRMYRSEWPIGLHKALWEFKANWIIIIKNSKMTAFFYIQQQEFLCLAKKKNTEFTGHIVLVDIVYVNLIIPTDMFIIQINIFDTSPKSHSWLYVKSKYKLKYTYYLIIFRYSDWTWNILHFNPINLIQK